jgi:uncharacterized protein (DUF1778 family)
MWVLILVLTALEYRQLSLSAGVTSQQVNGFQTEAACREAANVSLKQREVRAAFCIKQ